MLNASQQILNIMQIHDKLLHIVNHAKTNWKVKNKGDVIQPVAAVSCFPSYFKNNFMVDEFFCDDVLHGHTCQ